MRLAALFALIALPAFADVPEVLHGHILPAYDTLATETSALAAAAEADCAPEALRPAYHTAYDAWISASHIQFGPLEDQGLALAMAFWPDTRGTVPRTLAQLTAARDPAVQDPAAFAEVSVAAQGFTALERLLFEPQADDDYACALTRATATGLARKAAALDNAWPDFTARMETAGAPGNTRFQSEAEVQRALYTALTGGLEFLHDQRLGRPLGTFDRPRPERAEAYRSERSLRHVVLSLAALQDLATRLAAGDAPATRAAFAKARAQAGALDDPGLQGVADPQGRIRVEALQGTVREVQEAVAAEIGAGLGLSAGFNSMDGD